ncbi:MAG TPA: tyrosine-type recombinase/integrase [Ruminiclostridium sp.]
MYEKKLDVIFSNGIFTNLCQQFIDYKRGMGQKFPRGNQYSLLKICGILNEMDVRTPILTKEVVEAFAERSQEESPWTQRKRICFLRQFATFMSCLGFEAYVYPKHSIPQYKYDFRPYLFSHEQIIAIIKAADAIVPCNYSRKAHLVYPAIFRIIYGCGLRSAEARKLEVNNINLNDGILFIEKSKNNTSRYVPMSDSLTYYCRKYAKALKGYLKEYKIGQFDQTLFVNRSNTKLTDMGITYILKKYIALAKKVNTHMFKDPVSPHMMRNLNLYKIQTFC